MAQSNPKPTLYADRATVTSDHVTCAVKCASSVPTVNSPASAAPAGSGTPSSGNSQTPPIADAPMMGVLASVATASPLTTAPAVTVLSAAVVPTPIPTLVPISAAIVAVPTLQAPPTTETTALPATTTTTTTAAPAMVLVPQPAATSPPALVAAQNAAQPKMRQNSLCILSNGTVLPRDKNDQVSSVKTRYPYDRQQKHQHPTISPHISSYLTEEQL
ncbi:hypothetical protein B0H14DRAFT_2567032 [Mycena olivaceomarginata]|nr:hypothetical protein B0H14DRAFT_2567032 [Mycena olivaceomarginata]